MLIILDDWVGAGINMRNGLLPAMLTKIRHACISVFNLVQNVMAISPQVRMQVTHYMIWGLP